jgi:hypothetical protein
VPQRLVSACLGVAVATLVSRVHALETPPVSGEPVLVDVTESSSLIVNVDNRNDRANDVGSRVDDDWSMAYNRLHTQASWDAFRFDLRLDTAYYFTSRSPADVANTLLAERRRDREGTPYDANDAAFFVQKYQETGNELSDRFVDWTYPAKLSFGYETPDVEVTVGDFYAQYGQGLVLSVRKRDELSSDTTVRGVRVVGKLESGPLRLRAGALGGTMNPLRIDDTSGRHLAVTSGVLSGASMVTEAAMPRAIQNDFVTTPNPSYAPDQVLGVELEGRVDWLGVGLQGTRLSRSCVETPEGCFTLANDVVRSASVVDTGGVFVDLPRVLDGAFYVEFAHQRLSSVRGSNRPDTSGDALYARGNWFFSPVSVTLEGRHYRAFYPLRANIDVGRAPEFAPVQYSAPPTSEDVWVDTEFEDFNTCVTGGRVRVDVTLAPRAQLFGWVGRHLTWGESGVLGRCEPNDDNLNRVWDFAQGLDLGSSDRATHGTASVGTRFDSAARLLTDASGVETDVYYRELYLRHDVSLGLGGERSLQFQAWHRRRHQTLGGPEAPWLQGQTVTAFQLDASWGFALGLEYDENPAFPGTYVNGQVRYDFEVGNVTAFAGQRQGGLRCVSGICRVFPPFEGVRLDATLRF